MNLALQDEADKTVFISYAREDSAEAERLYRDLKNAGAKPWIDKEEIRAGENWDLALSKAIKNNRYFIPLFSSRSVDKIGYVNKELRYALEALDHYPEKSIFMIPVRLDDCEIPFEKLKKIHNADLFPDWNNGVKRIFKSMGIDIDRQVKEEQEGEERWIMGISEYHWNRLLKNIYEKKCIAFIGPGIYKVPNKDGRPLIPLSIVDKLKEKYSQPLEDLYELARIYTLENSYQLARLTQFLAIEDAEGNEIDPKDLLSEMIKEIDSSKFSFPSETRSPYDILEDLDLPIYITTNYDHFLEDALARSRRIRKQPQSDFFRWSDELIRYFKGLEVSSVFEDAQYKPTEERPLVYHIHGDIKNPQSMVLTEKDYFEFVINTNKEEAQDIPSILRKEIATSSLLFIGYSVDDIDFRTIFQGFLTFLDSMLAKGKREPSVAVQLPPEISKKGKAKMQRYLEQYTRNLYPNVHQFWGDTSDFITELDKRWRDFKQGK
jgi:SIR2-like domain/TIR domain